MNNWHNFGVTMVSFVVFPLIVWYTYYNFGKIESLISWTGYTNNLRDDIVNVPEFDIQWTIERYTCEDIDINGPKM